MTTYTMIFRSIDTGDVLERDVIETSGLPVARQWAARNAAQGERWELREGHKLVATGVKRGYDS
jgi:hypothetical protein